MSRLTESDTPLALVRIYEEVYPYMDKIRLECSDQYPSECYVPISAGVEVVRYLYENLDRTQIIIAGAEATCLYIWRKTKIIYKFDDTLAEVLAGQAEGMSGEEKLPIDLLLHMPFPCIYIKSGYFLDKYDMDGFFTWIEWDMDRKEYELRWQFVTSDMQHSVGFTMHLSRPTLNECLEETVKESKRWNWTRENNESEKSTPSLHVVKDKEEAPNPILVAMQMTLYLLADNRDEREDAEQRKAYQKSKTRKKTGSKADDPSSIRLKNVGVRVGATLRKAHSDSNETRGTQTSGSKKQTHLRRGHWHHYWTGPRNIPEERNLILRWVSPVVVNQNDEEPIVVVHPVN